MWVVTCSSCTLSCDQWPPRVDNHTHWLEYHHLTFSTISPQNSFALQWKWHRNGRPTQASKTHLEKLQICLQISKYVQIWNSSIKAFFQNSPWLRLAKGNMIFWAYFSEVCFYHYNSCLIGKCAMSPFKSTNGIQCISRAQLVVSKGIKQSLIRRMCPSVCSITVIEKCKISTDMPEIA